MTVTSVVPGVRSVLLRHVLRHHYAVCVTKDGLNRVTLNCIALVVDGA